MQAANPHDPVRTIKQVGANGQISLGKEFAGQTVQIEQSEPGVWLVRTVVVIPTNELWLHTPENSASLQRAVRWAQENPPRESDLERLFGDEQNGIRAKEESGAAAGGDSPSIPRRKRRA